MPPSRTNSRRGGFNTRFVKQRRERDTIDESKLSVDATSQSRRFDFANLTDGLDETFGFARYEAGPKKVGWLINMHTTIVKTDDSLEGRAAVDYYFLDDEGGSFKATVKFDPYFLISCRNDSETEVDEYLRRRFEGRLKNVVHLEKEDLSLPNHLVGLRRKLVRLEFNNVSDLMEVRKQLMPIVEANTKNSEIQDSYAEVSL